MAQQVIENHRIVTEEGVVLEEDTTIRYKTTEPDYVKLYIEAWCAFKGAGKNVNTNFLYHLLPYMTYAQEKQLIFLNAYIKQIIAEQLNWSEATLQNRFNVELNKLIRKKILKRVATSTYMVNPELIGRGEWKDIKNLQATFNLKDGSVKCNYVIDDKDMLYRS